jgi:hypothetical protein
MVRQKDQAAENLGHRILPWRTNDRNIDQDGQYWSLCRCENCRAKYGYFFGSYDMDHRRTKRDCRLIIELTLEKPCRKPAKATEPTLFDLLNSA